MNTANWIPDLFMKRMEARGDWTFFRTSDAADLHHLYGKKFEERYEAYEKKAEKGEIRCLQLRFGSECSRCCSRRGILGSHLRTPAT
jgi:ribonucleotide reductase alpha subunit